MCRARKAPRMACTMELAALTTVARVHVVSRADTFCCRSYHRRRVICAAANVRLSVRHGLPRSRCGTAACPHDIPKMALQSNRRERNETCAFLLPLLILYPLYACIMFAKQERVLFPAS